MTERSCNIRLDEGEFIDLGTHSRDTGFTVWQEPQEMVSRMVPRSMEKAMAHILSEVGMPECLGRLRRKELKGSGCEHTRVDILYIM